MGRSPGNAHSDRILEALAKGDAKADADGKADHRADRGAPAVSALAASWRRSGHLHALDPATPKLPARLTAAEVADARARLGRLLAIAQASLDRLFLAVGGVGCSVLLADADGTVLERRGARGDDATFESWGLWTGAVWSERHEGTNAIGTCLVEKRPLTIDRDQHYLSRNARLFCTTAPIFDEHGQLKAALDVSSCRADLTEGFSRLIATTVADAARLIEAENFRQAFPHARIVLTPDSEREINSLLAVDRNDLVIGATRAARRALNLSPSALARPVPAGDLIKDTTTGGDDIDAAERAVLKRALARAGGNVSKAAKELDMSRATLHRKMKRLGLER
ncbi:helix-turn-helix domain-containing protein [Bradyrhizobium sp. SZCCHNRI1009]|uniref:helix-turn-helix domain-containing protein n=1 Tax=Bradyrhizobium sp. SZCCHNRI1009 TaxID=3057277 RepID=UPI002915F95B|nr:helix-turn-helix domain-containing protein [Bradyrhizobium sp. SZCCHNRI1009]